MKMKCVCGYEYEEEIISGHTRVVKGEKPFIEINHSLCVQEDNHSEIRSNIKAFACPKCHTVKLNL